MSCKGKAGRGREWKGREGKGMMKAEASSGNLFYLSLHHKHKHKHISAHESKINKLAYPASMLSQEDANPLYSTKYCNNPPNHDDDDDDDNNNMDISRPLERQCSLQSFPIHPSKHQRVKALNEYSTRNGERIPPRGQRW